MASMLFRTDHQEVTGGINNLRGDCFVVRADDWVYTDEERTIYAHVVVPDLDVSVAEQWLVFTPVWQGYEAIVFPNWQSGERPPEARRRRFGVDVGTLRMELNNAAKQAQLDAAFSPTTLTPQNSPLSFNKAKLGLGMVDRELGTKPVFP